MTCSNLAEAALVYIDVTGCIGLLSVPIAIWLTWTHYVEELKIR